MRTVSLRRRPYVLIASAAFVLIGCVAQPALKSAPPNEPTPAEVALAPERYHGADVVWAGKILAVRNLEDASEVQVVSYPIDAAQRPDPAAPPQGRFIIVLPGYAEPLDLPSAMKCMCGRSIFRMSADA